QRPLAEDSTVEVISSSGHVYPRRHSVVDEGLSARQAAQYPHLHSNGQVFIIPDGKVSEEELAEHKQRHAEMMGRIDHVEVPDTEVGKATASGQKSPEARQASEAYELPSVGKKIVPGERPPGYLTR
ncbi:unnamed protein product, partial [Amoebophrya sp. A25]